MEFAVLQIRPQHEKAQNAPDRFVQKRRMHRQRGIHRDPLLGKARLHACQIGMGAVAVHAPGQRGVRAKRLLIEKIAPAANALPDQKAHTGQIEHWQNGHPAPFADEKGRCKRADHRAVDGKPALPDIQHLGKALVFKRRHRHIERAPSQHRKHRADEDHIHHPVGVDAEAARITERKQQRQQHAGGDEDAIPVDR